MPIQTSSLVAAISCSCILAWGAFTPGAAFPFLEDAPEVAAVPPVPDDLGRSDLFGELPVRGLGSALPGAEAPADPDAASRVPDEPPAPGGEEATVVSAPSYPVVLNQQVRFFIDRFTGSRREVVGRWFGRSERYLGMIREMLRSHGLPDELAFTAMIESGFDPLAVSRAGAKGLWQFMAATARRYGLRVDSWVDERLDPEKSTLAAVAYLRDLYQQFGSWALAQAAYNAGELKIARAIRATGSTDFWALARTGFLRQETKEFVPAIHAVTVIGRDPDLYGFESGGEVAVDVETVTVPGSTDLRRLSARAGVPVDVLRTLNAVLVRGVTPPGRPYELKIPPGARPEILAALAPARPVVAAKDATAVRASGRPEVHVVRPRDTVSSIAKRYGVSVNDLVRWNGLAERDHIRPGDRLRVAALRSAADR